MTLYLAVDQVKGISLPNGKIAGIAETSAGLVAQGFSSRTYRGNRVSTIDETDDGVWDNDCEPGWYYNGGSVQLDAPQTDIQRLKSAYRVFHRQINNWADGLDALSRGQPLSRVNAGHDWLYFAKCAGFLIASNLTSASAGGSAVTRSVNVRIGWARAMTQGALNVASPAQFYADPNEHIPPSAPVSWRNLSSPHAALSLGSALVVYASATAPNLNTVDFAMGSWIEGLKK